MTGQMAPFLARVQANNEALAIAVDGTQVVRCPIAGSVSRVTYTPEAAITGATTNNRTLNVVNKGQDGTGTTVVATLAFISGVNAAAFDETDLTLGVAANLVVAEGDVLALQSTHGGTGIVDPGGLFAVSINR